MTIRIIDSRRNILCEEIICRNVTINSNNGNISGTSIFPNPSNGLFTLNLGGEYKACTVDMYNVIGQRIFTNQMIGVHELQIDASMYAAGTYLIKVSDGVKIKILKLVLN